MRDQRIQFAGERCDLPRQLLVQALAAAGADVGELGAQAAKRHQAEADLQHHRRHQSDHEHHQRPGQRGVETGDLGLDAGEIAGDQEARRLLATG